MYCRLAACGSGAYDPVWIEVPSLGSDGLRFSIGTHRSHRAVNFIELTPSNGLSGLNILDTGQTRRA